MSSKSASTHLTMVRPRYLDWFCMAFQSWLSESALQPVKIRCCLLFSAEQGWKKKERLLTYSFDQATFACPHFSTNQVEMITQETNPVYWACTHCLTLEPWTVIISTFILVVQFDNTIRFATLESVRPGLTAKGSFKNSKSKGRNLFIHHLCEIFHFIVKCVTGKCNMTAVM